MLSYVGFGIMGVAFLLLLLNLVTDIVGMIIILVGAFFAIIPLFGKIQFGRRKLISKYKVLPIIDDVYAIKTCDGKVVFKYLDYEDNDNEVIDLLIDRNEVVEIFELEEPILKIYEGTAADEKIRNLLIAGRGFDSETEAENWLSEIGITE